MKTNIILSGCMIFALLITGCADKDKNKVTKVILKSIAVTPETVTLNQTGFTAQLTAVTNPEGADVNLEWHSENPLVASVSGDGLITAKKGGNTVIKVTGGGVETLVPVLVAVLVDFTVTPELASVELNAAQQLYVVTEPPEMVNSVTINYESDNMSVAMVSSSGLVTGVGVGETFITVSIGDISKTVQVTVTN
jgi:uncharacterized protein YjdB